MNDDDIVWERLKILEARLEKLEQLFMERLGPLAPVSPVRERLALDLARKVIEKRMTFDGAKLMLGLRRTVGDGYTPQR